MAAGQCHVALPWIESVASMVRCWPAKVPATPKSRHWRIGKMRLSLRYKFEVIAQSCEKRNCHARLGNAKRRIATDRTRSHYAVAGLEQTFLSIHLLGMLMIGNPSAENILSSLIQHPVDLGKKFPPSPPPQIGSVGLRAIFLHKPLRVSGARLEVLRPGVCN